MLPAIEINTLKRKTLEELHARAKIEAESKGFKEEKEDFAQWLILQYLEKKSQHQTIRQSFIDYRRKHHGDPGCHSGHARILGQARTVSIDPFGENPKQDFEIERSLEGSARVYEESGEKYSRALHFFTGRESVIWIARFQEKATLKEIADRLGVSKSRISQIQKAMVQKVAYLFRDS